MTMAKVKNEALKKEITAEIAQMKQGMGCSIEFDHVRKARHRENVFMQDLYDFSMKMIEYAERESSKGNLDELARQIIEKTGEGLFLPIKYHFYGHRDKNFEEL